MDLSHPSNLDVRRHLHEHGFSDDWIRRFVEDVERVHRNAHEHLSETCNSVMCRRAIRAHRLTDRRR